MAISRNHNIVDCVSVGVPPENIVTNIETVKFVIYDFKNREEGLGDFIQSPALKAHGYEWFIKVFPRFNYDSKRNIFTEEEYVGLGLTLAQQGEVTARVGFRCKEANRCFRDKRRIKSTLTLCSPRFRERQEVLRNLVEDDGSLVIEADIQLIEEGKSVWYPKMLQRQDLWVLLYQNANSKTSDVVFSVRGSKYRAHKFILAVRCKTLFEIADKSDDHYMKPILILRMRREIFKKVLDFIYTVKVPEIEDKDTAAELLVAADRFNCLHLKLYLESVIVDKHLNPKNAASLLILADVHSCALLKERAMNLIIADAETVRKAYDWLKIEESNRLLRELLDTALSSKRCVIGDDNDHNEDFVATSEMVDRLDVTALREELEEANLELHGSREILVDRWLTHRYCQPNSSRSKH